jgi:hypothetical protein
LRQLCGKEAVESNVHAPFGQKISTAQVIASGDAFAKWPLREPFCPDEIDEASADGDSRSDREAANGLTSVYKYEYESCDREKRWKRIQRDSEWTNQLWPLRAQDDYADVLKEELKQDPRDDQHGDDLLKAEEAED